MAFWLLLGLIFLFFFPAFFLPVLVVLGFIILLLLPFRFALHSIFLLLQAPGQIYQIAINKKLRKNHALEHATINLLEGKFGKGLFFSGLARENGFFIRGNGSPWEIEEAANEGLIRLQQGEKDLAIHSRCGTTILAVNLIVALFFLLFLFGFRVFSILNVFLAIILANLVGPYLGLLFQRYLTTSPQVGDVVIRGVESRSPNNMPSPNWFFVHTSFLKTL